MAVTLDNKLVVAISSRALFELGESNKIFETDSPHPYIRAFNADLFLSANPEDVQLALQHGHARASILTGINLQGDDTNEIRIAFDGDAVLFSDEAERIFQERGLDEFQRNEAEKSEIPLGPGPFKAFLEALNRIQKAFEAANVKPIRTALVTSRNAPSHKRAVKTLRHWGISIDEAFFLGGLDKTPILEQFRPHIFFDDQKVHCEPASKVVPTAQVLGGVANGR